MTEKFHKRFNIEVGLDEARRRFVNRANNFILANLLRDTIATQPVQKYLCSKLGERWTGIGCMSHVLGDDYEAHVRALEFLYQDSRTKNETDMAIQEILSDAEIDLGIRWNGGHFLPSGDPLLDDKLVNDALGILLDKNHDAVLLPFRKGLNHFLHSINRPELLTDTITDMHEALEALAKRVTGKDKDLSGNAELFISKLDVSQEYKDMLKAYILYANGLRHAPARGKQKPTPSRPEVESFIYITGMFIRLAVGHS